MKTVMKKIKAQIPTLVYFWLCGSMNRSRNTMLSREVAEYVNDFMNSGDTIPHEDVMEYKSPKNAHIFIHFMAPEVLSWTRRWQSIKELLGVRGDSELVRIILCHAYQEEKELNEFIKSPKKKDYPLLKGVELCNS